MDNYEGLSNKAASIIASQITLKENSVLGFSTGSTPEGMYSRLVQMYRQGLLDFNKVVTFNLDEYVGLSPDHPQSYHYFMHQHLFNHVNVPPENINIPLGTAENLEEHCRAYDKKIAAVGGIDLQVLGIGVNGHIGFNEPDRCLSAWTCVVDLSEATIKANSRFFNSEDEVPRQAITMGMASILHARRLMLLASGKSKARAIRETLSGKVSTQVPASFLQLHPNAIIVMDKEAASLL
jgi:glucosamine-6-phosphate deaminase